MAEEQKPVEVVQEQIAAAVAAEAPAVETTAVTTEETKPVEAAAVAETAAPAEEKKEVKPVEEGHLGHKAQGAAFPKYVYSKIDMLDHKPAGRTLSKREIRN